MKTERAPFYESFLDAKRQMWYFLSPSLSSRNMETQEKQILESSVLELEKVLMSLKPESPIYFYSRVLFLYLNGRNSELCELIENYAHQKNKSELWALLLLLAEMRKHIRQHTQLLPENLELLQKIESTSHDIAWKGETNFVLAIYSEVHKQDGKALDFYKSAQKHFHSTGLLKKSAKAFHNAVACESRLHPDRKLIPEYFQASQLAIEAQDWGTAGTALNNISREYQLMKAPEAALKYATQALEYLKRDSYGTYHFYNTLCHRCHLNLTLGYHSAALLDYQEACAARFPEIQALLPKLHEWLNSLGIKSQTEKGVSNAQFLRPTWKSRSALILTEKNKLSEQESHVLQALLSGPQSRHDLIEKIWGNSVDFFSLENRLKQILHRIRKKSPTLIGFNEGKYFIVDSHLTQQRELS